MGMSDRVESLSLVPPLHRATHGVGLFIRSLQLGVSQAEGQILAQLAAEGPSTVAALHAAFGHRRSTLTSILDRLAEAGLVERGVVEEDRRSFLISLTPPGASLAAKVHAAMAGLEAEVCDQVSAADLAGFQAVVTALTAAARRGAP
jgi:DNA-binding MarR family transcriptional regulator